MAAVNDIVLIYIEDTPISFARIESILPDAKKDWYHIKFLMLQIPLQVVTWILKDDYINGSEFHMNNQKMKLEKVEIPEEDLLLNKPESPPDKKNTGDVETETKVPGKIISFSDFKKNEPESG
ncbi:MAG: hypothetical protein HOG03_06165 [Desulfobacula sp.]|jgi:hypothetical protein|uniref:hypothetical protein n=1 Tax=Desulfobacula sp. TaxID=2593537 RepID=UPI001E00263B|nr:hypothetical protein [Desulfobacula sp.]MBT3485012.1 hypothetical protein [Desulfobacula sp.]MBT3804171.1 hypothetical protein [Desulfobacula sp.]MBT4025027.1 hypothetical protein [Desulfobacula sp.]MBT4198663.1 hypothetical protein [Desulfobacula sp.]